MRQPDTTNVAGRVSALNQERLDILRQHQQRVTAQIVALTTCLQMINFKVNLYQDSLTADPSDPIWSDIQDCLAYDK